MPPKKKRITWSPLNLWSCEESSSQTDRSVISPAARRRHTSQPSHLPSTEHKSATGKKRKREDSSGEDEIVQLSTPSHPIQCPRQHQRSDSITTTAPSVVSSSSSVRSAKASSLSSRLRAAQKPLTGFVATLEDRAHDEEMNARRVRALLCDSDEEEEEGIPSTPQIVMPIVTPVITIPESKTKQQENAAEVSVTAAGSVASNSAEIKPTTEIRPTTSTPLTGFVATLEDGAHDEEMNARRVRALLCDSDEEEEEGIPSTPQIVMQIVTPVITIPESKTKQQENAAEVSVTAAGSVASNSAEIKPTTAIRPTTSTPLTGFVATLEDRAHDEEMNARRVRALLRDSDEEEEEEGIPSTPQIVMPIVTPVITIPESKTKQQENAAEESVTAAGSVASNSAEIKPTTAIRPTTSTAAVQTVVKGLVFDASTSTTDLTAPLAYSQPTSLVIAPSASHTDTGQYVSTPVVHAQATNSAAASLDAIPVGASCSSTSVMSVGPSAYGGEGGTPASTSDFSLSAGSNPCAVWSHAAFGTISSDVAASAAAVFGDCTSNTADGIFGLQSTYGSSVSAPSDDSMTGGDAFDKPSSAKCSNPAAVWSHAAFGLINSAVAAPAAAVFGDCTSKSTSMTQSPALRASGSNPSAVWSHAAFGTISSDVAASAAAVFGDCTSNTADGIFGLQSTFGSSVSAPSDDSMTGGDAFDKPSSAKCSNPVAVWSHAAFGPINSAVAAPAAAGFGDCTSNSTSMTQSPALRASGIFGIAGRSVCGGTPVQIGAFRAQPSSAAPDLGFGYKLVGSDSSSTLFGSGITATASDITLFDSDMSQSVSDSSTFDSDTCSLSSAASSSSTSVMSVEPCVSEGGERGSYSFDAGSNPLLSIFGGGTSRPADGIHRGMTAYQTSISQSVYNTAPSSMPSNVFSAAPSTFGSSASAQSDDSMTGGDGFEEASSVKCSNPLLSIFGGGSSRPADGIHRGMKAYQTSTSQSVYNTAPSSMPSYVSGGATALLRPSVFSRLGVRDTEGSNTINQSPALTTPGAAPSVFGGGDYTQATSGSSPSATSSCSVKRQYAEDEAPSAKRAAPSVFGGGDCGGSSPSRSVKCRNEEEEAPSAKSICRRPYSADHSYSS